MSQETDPVIRVKDRRMFNPDGSLRVRDESEIREEESTPAASAPPPAEPAAAAVAAEPAPAPPPDEKAEPPQGEEAARPEPPPDFSGAPSLFSDLVVNLASQAAMYLGLVDNPLAPKMPADLQAARQMIDILAMLQEKTRGNLSADEGVLLERILTDLRMQYVAMATPRRK